jgi:hypothetical protein
MKSSKFLWRIYRPTESLFTIYNYILQRSHGLCLLLNLLLLLQVSESLGNWMKVRDCTSLDCLPIVSTLLAIHLDSFSVIHWGFLLVWLLDQKFLFCSQAILKFKNWVSNAHAFAETIEIFCHFLQSSLLNWVLQTLGFAKFTASFSCCIIFDRKESHFWLRSK